MKLTTNSSFGDTSFRDEPVAETDLPEVFNHFMVSLMAGLPPLSDGALNNLKGEMNDSNVRIIISELEVFQMLKKLKRHKATLTGAIPNELLIELADVLAAPISALINSSIRNGCIPIQWKLSRVTLVPKEIPVTKVENDFRPISITCPISSLAEKKCF